MKFRRIARALVCAAVTLPAAARLSRGSKRTNAAEAFFPVAVWYGGGKARAPMQERLDAASAERWAKDLDAIKAAGFNTVKDSVASLPGNDVERSSGRRETLHAGRRDSRG